MSASQSLENGRGRAFEALGTNDPRASREAAWRFVEAQKDFANPAFGRGPDEFDFSSWDGGELRRFPAPAREVLL
jgi:hypothetical protein